MYSVCDFVWTPWIFVLFKTLRIFMLYQKQQQQQQQHEFKSRAKNIFCYLLSILLTNLTFVYPWVPSIIVNDDQQDATILAYLFIPNQLYMFRAMSSPIFRSTWLYLQLLIISTDITARWCHGWDGTDVPPHPWHQQYRLTISEAVNSQVLLIMDEDIARNI